MEIKKLAYSMKAASAATCYSRAYLYKLIQAGELKTYRRGGRVFIKASELERLIEKDASIEFIEVADRENNGCE